MAGALPAMTISSQTLERGLQLYAALLEENSALEREFANSRETFFHGSGPEAAGDPLGARRHLEWFALERYSEVLGGVPAEVLQESWRERSEGDEPDPFLNSMAGIFEVTGIEAGQGIWMRDLFGLGEYPVSEIDAAEAFQPGDLVVGRVFPVGETLFRLSPASSVYRSADLLRALHADVERLRARRRGSLRIAQSELEAMFHAPGAAFGEAPAAVDPARAAETARAELEGAGTPPELAADLVARVEEAADRGAQGEVTEALNQLAFDTEADLDGARRALLALWGQLRTGPATPPAAGGRPAADTAPEAVDAADPEQVAEALARFDEGRAEGGDLEQLFRTLEADLGLEAAGEDDGDDAAPDFPGVVAAMVEEFLWETERESGAETAAAYRCLDSLGEFAQARGLGVFENVGAEDLLEFAGRWSIESGRLTRGDQARALLEALGAFCRWCEERQEVPLWSAFEAAHGGLSASLPRLVELQRRLDRQVPLTGTEGDGAELRLYTFRRDPRGAAELHDAAGEARSVHLHPDLDGLLRPGDRVRARVVGDRAELQACYPAELAPRRG